MFESAAPSMNQENQAQLSTATRHLRHLSTLPIDAKVAQTFLVVLKNMIYSDAVNSNVGKGKKESRGTRKQI